MKDRALQTAHEMLSGTICECGDLEGEHIMDPEKKEPEPCQECECAQFRAVAFAITRLPSITNVKGRSA